MADLSYKFAGVNTAQLANEVQLLRQNSATFRGPSTRTIQINSDESGSWGDGGRQATVGEVIAHELAHAVVPKEFKQRRAIDYTESGKEGMWVRRQAGQVAGDLGLPGANNADYLITRIPVDKEQACTRRNPRATTPQDGVLFLDGSRGYNGMGSTVPPGLGDPDASSSQRLATDDTGQFDGRFGSWSSAPARAAPSVAPDLPESFDSRFGNWGTAPAGRFGNTRSPVLRALEKYNGSVVPGGSVSTSASAQDASWGRPPSPRNIIGTGSVLGNYVDPGLIAPAQGALPPSPISSGPIAPDLPTDESAGSEPVRYVSRRFTGPPRASISNVAAGPTPPSPQPSEPLPGIFSSQPMYPFPLPPSIRSRPDDTRSPDDEDKERSSRWLRLLSPE